jgi:predicted metal-binding protein
MQVACIESGPKDREQIKAFLKALCELAAKEGADAAGDISCQPLPWVTREAKPPEVPPEKRSIHWPEPAYPRDDLKQALGKFQYAVVFRVDCGKTGADPAARDQDRQAALLKVYTIASKLESTAFYGGYHLALSLAAGNCREVFCGMEEKCRALKKGSPCRHPLRARLSMEACGLDVREIAARAGWAVSGAGDEYLMGMVFLD